ncbi:hypothetical protein M413DRAFT_343992 [Hebeloma cylindrosporum]|uniref:MYND-type domain-containing protein n=1 Tax=Hebeloma cylindrosporum TaxID=76867 RepID=A0A0C2Y6W4_HEBCY|nr:hypothetical protein M413DRAFT_343992 [Hebeloma cylindrosporum h7]
MSATSDFCAKCSKTGNLRRCSMSERFLSRECQFADWKSHKKTCDRPEGSDAPKDYRVQDDKDTTTIPKPPESNLISGVTLHPSGYSSNTTSRGPPAARASSKKQFAPTHHPIFTRGELCPRSHSALRWYPNHHIY